jgi:surface polysaccharide O-acyltransferase-like enzyme
MFTSGFQSDLFTPFTSRISEFLVTGNIGVNIFMLITGYFIINTKFSFKKFFTLILTVHLWAYAIVLFFYIFDRGSITWSPQILLIPIILIAKQLVYWYIIRYLLIYLLTPLIAPSIKAMTKKQHLTILAVFALFTFIIPNWNYYFPNLAVNSYFYIEPSATWYFVFAILVGSYIRKFTPKEPRGRVIIISAALIPILAFLQFKTPQITELHDFFNIFSFAYALCLFIIFKNMNFTSKIINYIAKSMLAVYIIHGHDLVLIHIFRIIPLPFAESSNWFVVSIIIDAVFVFGLCTLIDITAREAKRFIAARLPHKKEVE